MNVFATKAMTILATTCLLMACTPSQQEVNEFSAPPASSVSVSYDQFNISLTIRDVMNTLIDPNADVIWEAVAYEDSLENGIVESKPETAEEWDALRKNVIAMVEGANSLMIPGRRVAPAGSTTDFPDAEYEPLEVEEKLLEDRASWVAFAQAFQLSALSVLDAIEARDLAAYIEAGGALDDACTACHQQYWYRTKLR